MSAGDTIRQTLGLFHSIALSGERVSREAEDKFRDALVQVAELEAALAAAVARAEEADEIRREVVMRELGVLESAKAANRRADQAERERDHWRNLVEKVGVAKCPARTNQHEH